MRKKLIFTGLVLLALVLTTGTFAYTYTNQAATTALATMADGNWASYQKAASQPNWNSILPNANTRTEMLVPVADSCIKEFPSQYPCSGPHFEKVSDFGAPDMDAYISTMCSMCLCTDLYDLSPFDGMGGTGKISGVTIYFRIAAGGDYNVSARGALKTGYQVYEGPYVTVHGTEFITKTWACAVNPGTGKAWTWDEVNNLQAGLSGQGGGIYRPLLCTAVWVQVSYTYTLAQGAVPTGDLYDITPYPGYMGDFNVKIYITNTAALLKAYEYCNMKLYLAYSIEAGETPNYQVLSLENGVASFNVQGGSAASYTVSIVGGGYRFVSDTPEEWSPGWTVEPEFYCEVSQR
ncbi:MAG: hypothetical protein WC370_09285 [Dehalococcoidales bacterium]|jgi:hypothetical protein